ncbi:MAG: carboxypeptidase regulatory-like domain-containing protein [Terracidiphilus sp.]
MTKKLMSVARWSAIIALLCLWQPCFAQFGSNVQGTVTDPTGAVIPKAAITLHSTGSGVDLKETTNSTGYYRFTAVAPGDYTVVVTVRGFKTESIAVTLTPDETRAVDVTLVPAAAGSVNVTVSAQAPDLNTAETRVETTLASGEITQLPLANHDVQELIALTPGVTGFQNESANSGYGSSIFAGSFGPPYSANGAGSNSNLYLIDDLPVGDDITQGNALIIPNSDMIDQVALQTQTYSVENGTSASLQVGFSTKTGTNDFHGDLDYSYAGKNLAAANNLTNTFPTVGGVVIPTPTATDPEFHENQFLVSLGGPIIKDKTFFFGSMEKQLAGIGNAGSVGTQEWDPAFVAWALNAFPNSGFPKALTFAPNSRDFGAKVATAQDVIPGTCGTTQTVPASTSLTYNLPCSTPMYDSGMLFNQAQPFNGTQWNVRLDQVFREGKDRVYVMYERIDQMLGNLGERPALDGITPSQNKYFSANYVHLFSDRMLNEVHAGNLRSISGSQLRNPAAAGIPYYPQGLDTTNGFAFMQPVGQEPFAAQTNWEHTYALRDTLSYTLRNHTIRGGYQFSREDYFQDSSGIYSRPFFPFYFTDVFSWISNSAQAGYNLYTIGGNGLFNPQYYGATVLYNGVWADDTWKVRENLTITVGLRYNDFGNPAPYSKSALFSPLFPGVGSTFQEQTWNTSTHIAEHAFTGAQNDNWMPRAGFAYTPMKSKQLFIHGGIGLYENVLTPYQIANNLPTQPPERISLYTTSIVPFGDFKTTSAPYGYNYGKFPTYGQDAYGNIYSNPTQTSVYSANLNGFAPNIKPEKFLNWSLGVEQQLPARVVAGVTYSGGHGYDLVAGSQSANGGGNVDFNLTPGSPKTRPDAEWGQLNYGRNALSSNYNALILTLRQHYKTLTYQANYNWARALQWAPAYDDTNTGGGIYVWPGAYDPKVYYGPSVFDVTNSFSFGGTYEVPKFSASSRLINEAISGWRLSTITIAQTGTPFTVGWTGEAHDYQHDGSNTFDGNGGGTPGFPTYKGGLPRKGFSRKAVSLTGAFTAADFTDPAGVVTSTVRSQQGANTFRNPGYFTVNGGFSKAFAVPFFFKEDAKFILRGDFINLLNRTNWQAIDNDITDSTFGYSKKANQKRYLQLGGRFQF